MNHILTTAWKILHGTFLTGTKDFVTYLEEQGINPDVVLQAVPYTGDFWTIVRGPRKGMTVRRFVQRNWNPSDRVKLAEAITGFSAEAIDAAFHFIKNEEGQTMYSLVLGDTDPEYKAAKAEYIQHWMEVYLNNKWVLDRIFTHRSSWLPDMDTTDYTK